MIHNPFVVPCKAHILERPSCGVRRKSETLFSKTGYGVEIKSLQVGCQNEKSLLTVKISLN